MIQFACFVISSSFFESQAPMGSVDYYAPMTHRDRLFHRRCLAAATVKSSLAFLDGNET
ncbi:hypothetical protein Hanom_Chr05g00438751 [Helianthus anomalus]